MEGLKQMLRACVMTAAVLAAGTAFAAPADKAAEGAVTPGEKAAQTLAPKGPEKVVVPESEQLQFTQKNVEAQMQELQERMFRLAEVTKEAEPDSSTRLLLAVRKARESLIIEQMKEVLDKLASKDLSKASTETKAVLVKLAELRELLIATDLDLQLQLERLRQLNAAIKKLDGAIKEENKQQAHTEELAKKDAPKPDALDQAKKDQEANRKKAEEVKDAAKSLSVEGAVKPLGDSSSSMSKAENSLGGGKPGDASPSQVDATKQMNDAKQELEKARQQVLAELQKQIKRVVMENLKDMLDRQGQVRVATEALSPRLEKERAAVLQLQQLGPAEERIAGLCQQTLDLVNETEFSVALPPALENVERHMLYAAGDLTGGRGDQRVIAVETGVEEDLRELLETFKEMSQDGKAGECKGCKGDKNKLTAELKVLRMLQMRINRDTKDVDADAHRAAAAAELPKPLRDKIGKVRDGEDEVRNAMERLHERFGPNSEQPEEAPHDPNTI